MLYKKFKATNEQGDSVQIEVSYDDMRGARFDGMSLGHSSFEYVDLEGASFRGCDLSVRYELDSVSDSKGDFFYGGRFYSEGTSMVGALLSGVDWEGANVEGVIYN